MECGFHVIATIWWRAAAASPFQCVMRAMELSIQTSSPSLDPCRRWTAVQGVHEMQEMDCDLHVIRCGRPQIFIQNHITIPNNFPIQTLPTFPPTLPSNLNPSKFNVDPIGSANKSTAMAMAAFQIINGFRCSLIGWYVVATVQLVDLH